MTNPSLMLIMRLVLLGWFWTFSAAVSDDIKISSAELKDLRPETETVLAFFTRRSGCSSCAAAADELRSVLPSLGMKTYLVEDGKETAEYADRVPALVMFHGHTPVLYEGPMEGDAFAEFVTTNREPRVVILNDGSFEHLTQAATGATTGDWLVML
ncbi:hypothetical protein FJT64_007223 [Amphibalanus amphitrite]|uniref:Thioredoxin domain-containing protein n=1 Tax=Amphibalanus amphitrite TaxID=1232801 RepID=A0A6A4VM49_AMPAM|nr:hypothetical protein FJT64_007223 [Amphibalanus amphitrite]